MKKILILLLLVIPCVVFAEEEAKRLVNLPKPSSTPTAPSSGGHTAGERMVKMVNGVEYAFRWCPAGTFTMGSPTSETGRYDDETQHSVTLTKGFWMLETEVTVGMYRQFVEETGYPSGPGYDGNGGFGYNTSTDVFGYDPKYTWRNNGFPQEDNHPVANVDWDDANAFCKWLSGKWKVSIQLPTEAQWEWCADWYDNYPSGSVTDPEGTRSGTYRVPRGGSWNDGARNCRSANRNFNTPTNRGNFLGFRLVLFVP